MKRLVFLFLTIAVVVGLGVSQAKAAEPKPIAALAVTNYDNLIGDVNFVGGLAERPQLGVALDGLVTLLTQGKGLAGVDKARPWGAIVQANGEEDIVGYLCVPITNFNDALDLLKLYHKVTAEGEVYKLTPQHGGQGIYVKKHGDWACFSDKAESLANIASDPLAALTGLEKDYLVAGRIFVANVPERLRAKFIAKFKSGIEKEAASKKADESDEQYAQRKKFVEQVEAYLVRVVGDLDQINAGWALDRTAGKTYVDFSVTAKPGTETAAEMAMASQATTMFAGFRPADAMSMWAIASAIPQAKQEIAASLTTAVRGKVLSEIEKNTPEKKRGTAKEVAGNVFDLLAKIITAGRIDAVLTSEVGPNSATGLGAAYVADGALLDKILHEVVAAAEEEHPELAQYVNLDAETVNGLKVHKVSIPVPGRVENRGPLVQQLVQLIGEDFDVIIAVGKENVYFAAGRDAEAKLKKAIDSSNETGSKAVSPLIVSFAIEPITDAIAVEGKADAGGR